MWRCGVWTMCSRLRLEAGAQLRVLSDGSDPYECGRTENVLLSAIEHGVKNVVVLSTDKAAYPINAMGISKALMERWRSPKDVSWAKERRRRSAARAMAM